MILAMIKPVDCHGYSWRSNSSGVDSLPPSQAQRDILCAVAREPKWTRELSRFVTRLQKKFPKYLLIVWNWVKYNLFFFFFDEVREKNLLLADELATFAEKCYQMTPSDEAKTEVLRLYNKLSDSACNAVEVELKERISQSMFGKPYSEIDRENKQFQDKVEKVLKEPFYEENNKVVFLDVCLVASANLQLGE